MRPLRIAIVAICTLLALVATAAADHKYHPVPKSKLQLRVVSYDGAVNGKLTVEVKNTGKATARFSAEGLYFVPDGDPDRAPQRLGAVGPLTIASDEEQVGQDHVAVPAGGKVTVVLDVFCIDSHRDSPTSETAFSVGRHRMPPQLAAKISTETSKAAADSGGYAAPAAKDAIQSTVWKERDARWIKLDGEGAQEADK